MKNAIHTYYRKEIEGKLILIQIDPETYRGLELIVSPLKKLVKTRRQYDAEIYEDLKHDAFSPCSPLEFNLYLKGLKK